MTNPILVGLCEKERRKFEELAQRSNLDCESYPDIIQLPGIPYMDHDQANHSMDLYYPAKPSEGLPIIIDIHGGGLISGTKEFNKPFCCELARTGFIVFAVEYPKAPETSIGAILNDILIAEAKAVEAASVLRADTNHICLVGDSGGAFLALYTAAMIRNPVIAKDFKIQDVPNVPVTALGLISGLMYTTANDFYGAFYKRVLYSKGPLRYDIPKYVNPDCEEIAGTLPPCYLITSEGDYLKDYTVRFAKALSKYSRAYVLRYLKELDLTHDFPVMDVNNLTSKGAIADMSNVFKRYICNSNNETPVTASSTAN